MAFSNRQTLRLRQRRRDRALPAVSPGRGSSTQPTIDSPERPPSPSSQSSSMSSLATFNPPSSPGRARNKITIVTAGRSNLLPPTISPGSPSRSWDEGDVRPPSPGGGGSWKQPKRKDAPKQQPYTLRKVQSSPTNSSIFRRDEGDRKPTRSSQPFLSDESSSAGEESPRSQNTVLSRSIVEGTSNTLRLVQAIQQNAERPTGLSSEERLLWDAVQMAKRAARTDALTEQFHSTHASRNVTDSSWETRLVQIKEQAMSQKRDNSRSLEEIHRVLAEVQAERDHAVSQLQDYRNLTDDLISSCESTTSMESSPVLPREQVMAARIAALERELHQRSTTLRMRGSSEETDPNSSIQQPHLEEPGPDMDKGFSELKLKPSSSDSVDTTASTMTHPSSVQFESHLRDAKTMIATLDAEIDKHRAKVNERDEEIGRLHKELAGKQKKLDLLVKEIRDLQRQETLTNGPTKVTEAERVKRLQLSSRLETNLADIRAAAVILESTQDASAVSNLAKLLTDSASTLREGIEVIENGASDDGEQPFRLWRELEEKKKAIKRLEDDLNNQAENYRQLRNETEKAKQQREEDSNALQYQIKLLRQQCDTNMEVLTKKETELAVLRDSLNITDDVGYISDDDDFDDEDEHVSSASPPPTMEAAMMLGGEYGHSQAEALATLRAQGGNHSFDSGSGHAVSEETSSRLLQKAKAEAEKLRAQYEKDQQTLKRDKEQISTLKMIISSLSSSNKKTMEAHQCRLEDSNSTITKLLEELMESKKANDRLRGELESLRRDAEQIDAHIEEQIDSVAEEEEAMLALPPAPEPLPLTETID